MNTYPKVTVIVPVYNTAPYLERCLSSLAAQTYPNYEVLLIDDGSTDGSDNICREWAEKDIRFRVKCKTNGGQASARNCGLELASPASLFCIFADSDDTVESNYIEYLVKGIGNADLAICGIKDFYGDDSTPHINTFPEETMLTDVWNNKAFFSILPGGLFNSPCNKLFRLDIIRDNCLEMRHQRVTEDIDFNLRYLEFCDNVALIPDAPYHYRHRNGSTTSLCHREMFDNYLDIHARMLARSHADTHADIDEFLYRQYLALTLRAVQTKQKSMADFYMRKPLVKRAFSAHRCANRKEQIVHTIVRHRAFSLLRIIEKFR